MTHHLVVAAAASALCVLSARAFDADTIAFYSFNDAAAGADADGGSVTNSVDGSKYLGTATKAGGEFKFADDRPAKYIFASTAFGAELLATDPGSLLMNSGVSDGNIGTKENGTVTFANLAGDIGGGDFTVEFYYKYQGGGSGLVLQRLSAHPGQVG